MYGMEHGSWMFGAGSLMLLWWLVPLVVVAALAAWLLKRPRGDANGTDALEILRQRYARGEIDGEEFREARRNLGA